MTDEQIIDHTKGFGSERPAARRRPWVAALLSLTATGAGQIYNGQWRKGLTFFLIETALGVTMIFGLGSFAGLVGTGAGLLAFNVAVAAEAYGTARRVRIAPTRFNRWWVYLLAVGLSLGAGALVEGVIKARFYQNFKVPSVSMTPTLRVGDRFMARRLDPAAVVARGEVVVFMDEASGRYFVKRVVGLPGETVRMQARRVYVDGVRLDEPYVRPAEGGPKPERDDYPPTTLEAGSYFLLGDNRDNSYDSRFIGPVGREAIVARALYVYFPGDVGARSWADRFGQAVR
jgi:signal peptidase I